MRRLFQNFYGRLYKSVAEMIFGYLLIFIAMPFVLPYYFALYSSGRINMKHGFSEEESTLGEDGRGMNFIGFMLSIDLVAGLIFLITSVVYLADNRFSLTLPLICLSIIMGIMPLLTFLANLRTDYVKTEKKIANKKETEDFYKSLDKEKSKSFQETLKEFKQVHYE